MTDTIIYPLKIHPAVKDEVERWALALSITTDKFILEAVNARLASLEAADFFKERVERADFDAFDRLMARTGGVPPAEGDRLK